MNKEKSEKDTGLFLDIRVDEILTKRPMKSGGSGKIYTPRSWIGEQVVLIKRKRNE